TPGGAPGEHTALVGERDRQPVHLGLGHVADLPPRDVEPLELALHSLRPGPELVLVARVPQGEHRLVWLDLLELVERGAPDPLGGRVRSEQLRMFLLDSLELAEQVVVLGIRDLRVVQHVVAAVVVSDLPPQLVGTLGDGLGGAHRYVEASAPAVFSALASIPAKSHLRSRSRLGRAVRAKWTGGTEIRSRTIAERSAPSSSSKEGSKP